MSQKGVNPRQGTETDLGSDQLAVVDRGQKGVNPRQGTETTAQLNVTPSISRQKGVNPRQGTETVLQSASTQREQRVRRE